MLVCVHLHFGYAIAKYSKDRGRELKSRIIGGKSAKPQRYPYFTYLSSFTKSGQVFFCGGSLVSSDVVLTAAHCITNFFEPVVKIKAYVNYTQSIAVTWNLTEYVYVRDAIAWIPHNNFDQRRFQNDIALIILNNPVYEVSPVKLNNDTDLLSDNNTVSTIGHGIVSQGATPGFPYYLNEVEISIVSFEDCNDMNSYKGLVVNETMICAGDPAGVKSACRGDSGGPLLIVGNTTDTDLLVGVNSFGVSRCVDANYPTVFTRVSNYSAWIHDTICQHSNKKPSSCSNARPTKKPTKNPFRKPTKKPTNASSN
jgi:secreted trypsin-like serine protease